MGFLRVFRRLEDSHFLIPVLFILLLALKHPILDLPYHWDALGYVVEDSLWLAEHGLFTVSHPDVMHPPLLFMILGFFYRIFGESPRLSHTIILFFSAMGVFYTYMIGRRLFNREVGAVSALLLLFSPTYYALSGIVVVAVPLTSLMLATIYYSLEFRVLPLLVFGIATVLVKSNGFFVILALLAGSLIRHCNERWRKEAVVYAIPLACFIIAIAYYTHISGHSPLNPHERWTEPVADYSMWCGRYLKNLSFIAAGDHRHILTVFFIFDLARIIALNSSRLLQALRECFIRYGPFILLFLLFSVQLINPLHLPRHALPMMPLFFLFTVAGARRVVEGRAFHVMVIALFFLYVGSWQGSRSGLGGHMLETNMEYVDMVKTHMETASYLSENHPNARVLTTFPELVELRCRWAHYSNGNMTAGNIRAEYDYEAMGFYLCGREYPADIEEDYDFILYSPESNYYGRVRLEEMLRVRNHTLVKRSEINGKYSEVYEVQR
ncbi:MAG: glycosyltransferase family 39 protein [Candidatus Altiarchaeota archaeon]